MGLALLCDDEGVVRRVLRDDFHDGASIAEGAMLAEIFDAGCQQKVTALLAEIQERMAALDWELDLRTDGALTPLYVAGGFVQGQILIVGALSRSGMAARFYEDLMQINNEQMNALRSALKELSMRTREREAREAQDQELYGELTRLNNELVNLQRELEKKNAELREQRERYRLLSENLEQRVVEKVRELELERAKAIQMDKLASLGQMATGVAHELNQPLTAISFEADYLKLVAQKSKVGVEGGVQLPVGVDELAEVGDNLAGDVARCRRIIDHLRAFGRVSDRTLKPINLNDAVEGSLTLVGARLRHHDVQVELDLAPDLPPITADVNRLEQVFLNFISNAEYAMAERAACEEGHRKLLSIATYRESSKVIAVVGDNGTGIPESVRERIFEPFFTTKPVGEGTGLGMSISYGIVTDFGGEIDFESRPNEGTTFTLRFPIAGSAEGGNGAPTCP
jgi:C4-dicarboxylate-specific signal transduction histidine kinase